MDVDMAKRQAATYNSKIILSKLLVFLFFGFASNHGLNFRPMAGIPDNPHVNELSLTAFGT